LGSTAPSIVLKPSPASGRLIVETEALDVSSTNSLQFYRLTASVLQQTSSVSGLLVPESSPHRQFSARRDSSAASVHSRDKSGETGRILFPKDLVADCADRARARGGIAGQSAA
jgi:hypothetical protein